MASRRVFVFTGGSELRVYPPVVVLKGGTDTMQVVNGTESAVRWIVDDGVFEDGGVNDRVPGKKSQKNKSDQRKALKADLATTYRIEMTTKAGRRKRARGNSDPVIIIDT